MGELQSAHQQLSEQDDVDPASIVLFGISMGATLAYWMATARFCVTALTHLCFFVNFDSWIET